MTNATAIFRQIKYKVESAYGTVPAASGSQLLRRTEFSPDLTKETYQSKEIRSDQQVADFRHGTRKAGGTLKGELAPKAFSDFIAAALRRDWTAVTPAASLSLTISGSSAPFTVARGSGSWLTDGFKVGDVIRLTGAGLNAANSAKNLFILSVVALSITVMPLNGVAMAAEGPIASCTATVVGKKTYAPTTGHTDKSYSIESWFSDLSKSEVYSGMKVNSIGLSLPSSGISTIDVDFMGQNVTTATSEYFTTPTAASAYGALAAVNGVLSVGGSVLTSVRDLSLKISGNLSGAGVVGSNLIPALYAGSIVVDGQFTAYFDSTTLRDAFLNETELSLSSVLTCDNTAAADFIAFTLPRIKVGSASKNDAQDGIVQTFQFQALYKSAGGAGTDSEQTTISVQDSQAA